jgi:hypothetical protein
MALPLHLILLPHRGLWIPVDVEPSGQEILSEYEPGTDLGVTIVGLASV